MLPPPEELELEELLDEEDELLLDEVLELLLEELLLEEELELEELLLEVVVELLPTQAGAIKLPSWLP